MIGLEIGAIVEGRVTGITKFGAFVAIPGGRSGLVHISEVANAYVNDVNDYLSVGQMVKVRILGVNEAGKINLSIKQAMDPPPPPPPRREPERPARPAAPRQNQAPRRYNDAPRSEGGPRSTGGAPYSSGGPRYSGAPHQGMQQADPPSSDRAFEDRLKKFMQESDSRIADNRMYSEHRQRNRRK